MGVFEKSKAFIYRNARPLDLARWQYHFENGSRDAVLKALSHYQNEDGGFGTALEADCFNPNSAPVQVWAATEILKEINFTDNTHPLIQGILRYLESGAGFDEEHNQWLNVMPENNEYPHAIWWEYGEGGSSFNYNPTACLAGFIIRFAGKETPVYKKACKIIKEAYAFFRERVPFEEMHETSCFIRMYEYLAEAGLELVDMEDFKEKLIRQVAANICQDTDKWETEYVTLPSNFIRDKRSIFYEDNQSLVEKECGVIIESQLADGSYPLAWEWCTGYREFTLAANWWKADFVIKNMLYLKAFDAKEL